MSTHTVRFPLLPLIEADEKLRPHTPTSRASTPAYHSSPGASTTETDSLDSSWFPVEPISPTHSNSEGSDDDTLSSSIYSIGSDTAHSLTSTESDIQVEEGYVDAEASTHTTTDTSSQLPLIFPHYDDLENSFASTSDETTPSASVQLQTTSYLSQAPTPVVRGQRSSSYRLSLDKGGDEGKAGSLWGIGVDGGYQGSDRDTIEKAVNVDEKVEKKIEEKDEEVVEKEAVTAHEIREGVKTDRLRRALAASSLTNLRGSQKWSSKISILTLASLLGLVLATVRYSIIPTSSPPASPEVTATNQVKPFSILDYLPSTSMEAPNSIMPDVRLIKNALSLSTVRPTINPVQSSPEAKSVATVAGSYSLALRNSEAGLIAFLQNSGSRWQRAKEMVRPSPPPPVTTQISEGPSYSQIIYSDLKTAWSKTLSTYSHTEFIHYIRNQIIATIQLEIQQALILATYLIEVGKNATRAATPYFQQGLNRTQRMYDNLKSFGSSINMPTTDIAASAAKAASDSVASKAAMTSQKGREAIQQARQGLEYLIQEAKRRAGPTSPEALKEEVGKGRFSGLKNKIRNHKGKAVQNPNRGTQSKSQMKEMREEKGKKMTMRERLMLALHNAAMPLVV